MFFYDQMVYVKVVKSLRPSNDEMVPLILSHITYNGGLMMVLITLLT